MPFKVIVLDNQCPMSFSNDTSPAFVCFVVLIIIKCLLYKIGYIVPFVMNILLGETGGYLLLTMLMMALMSTGSGEVMAISSILVYDIYKTYVNPFRYDSLSIT